MKIKSIQISEKELLRIAVEQFNKHKQKQNGLSRVATTNDRKKKRNKGMSPMSRKHSR
jgi:hypothetical protein